MNSDVKQTQHFVHGGRFLKIDENKPLPEKRNRPDRRQSLKGDPSKSATGKEQRKGSRRLEDVIITIEVKDPKAVYVNDNAFKHMVINRLQKEFVDICKAESVESLLDFTEESEALLVETKLKHRDKVKRFVLEKGLTFEVVDNGVYLGDSEKKSGAKERRRGKKGSDSPDQETTEISAILGFPPDTLNIELERLVFKVFVKCLNEVHPVSGDHERDALKQDVSMEQRIIFMAGKHYPKSENFTYKVIVEQVFTGVLKEYNKTIQLAAEVTMLEERFQLSNDNRLKKVIKDKNDELQRWKESTIEETVRTLYLYLDYFKEITKVGSVRERIENIFKKVNEKQIEVLNLEQICQQLHQIIEIEEKIKGKKSEQTNQYLGYLKWLKNEITNEIYFTRHLWVNNMKGKAYIDNAIERTFQAVEYTPSATDQAP